MILISIEAIIIIILSKIHDILWHDICVKTLTISAERIQNLYMNFHKIP